MLNYAFMQFIGDFPFVLSESCSQICTEEVTDYKLHHASASWSRTPDAAEHMQLVVIGSARGISSQRSRDEPE